MTPYGPQKQPDVVSDPATQRNFEDLYSKFPLRPEHIGVIPACRVYNDAAITTASGVNTFLTFNQERYDDPLNPMHSTSANTGRITFSIPGVYLVTGHVTFVSAAGGFKRQIALRVNGATYIAASTTDSGSADTTDISVATAYRFVASDYVELSAYQISGGNLNVTAAGNYSPEFAATWLCP